VVTLGVENPARAVAFCAAPGWQQIGEGGGNAPTLFKICAAPTFWGGYGGCFADLGGHIWEIAHNPYWFDADGNVIADQTKTDG
jgi:hypothetical protein